MKTSFLRLLSVAAVLAFGSLTASAVEAPSEAKVVSVTGSVQARKPGQAQPAEVRVGDMLPQGTEIITGAGAEAQIQPFSGAVSTIKANATVTLDKLSLDADGAKINKQTARLNLKSGSLVSTLDPTKRNINDYGVSTPKGVAAARGTVYNITVNASGTSVATLHGTVSFELANGTRISIDIGTGVVMRTDAAPGSTPQPVNLSALSAENAEIKQGIADTVAAVASSLGDKSKGSTDSVATATEVLAAVVKAASAAVPDQAANFVTTAINSAVQTTNSNFETQQQKDDARKAILGAAAAPLSADQRQSLIQQVQAALPESTIPDADIQRAVDTAPVESPTSTTVQGNFNQTNPASQDTKDKSTSDVTPTPTPEPTPEP